MENRKDIRSKALTVTFCGVMVALGAAIMLLGGLFGVLTYAAPLVASICLIPVISEFGSGRAWLAYLATAILSALVSADKEEAFFYVFIGFYPMIRPFIMRLKPRILRAALKLIVFSAAVAGTYAVLCFVFRLMSFEELVSSDLGTGLAAAFFAALIAVLFIFDLVLGLSERIYLQKLRPKLKFLR